MSKPDLNTSSRESLKQRKLDAGEAGADLANLGINGTLVPLTAKTNSSKNNIAAERRNTEGSKESSVHGADSNMNTPQNVRLAPMELYKGDYDQRNKNIVPVTTKGLIKNGNKKGIMSAVEDGGQQFSTILMNSQSQQQHQDTTKKIIARDGKSQMSSMPRHKVAPVSSFAQGETEHGPISQMGSKKPITTDDSQNDGNTLQSKRDTALIHQGTVGIIIGAQDESYGNFNNQATPQNNTRMLSEQTTLTENKPTSVDIKIVNKSTDRSGMFQNGQSHQYQVTNNGEMITLQTQTQAQFFKLSADEKLKSAALRRRQNKLYLNKLPRTQNSKEKVLYPSGFQSQPQQNRAANGLQTGGPQSTTQMEVAAWMGRKAKDQNRIHKVGNHIEEMGVLQKVTQLAPAHGKERTSDGIYIHGVSGARQAMFIDAGLKRTYPLTMQTGAHAVRSTSRQSQQYQDPNQEFENYARTLNEQIVRHDSTGSQPEDNEVRALAGGRKSNLRSSSRQIVPIGANQGIFNENQVYANQHIDSLKRQSTDIVRNVEWDTKDKMQHLSSEVFTYNKSGKLLVNNENDANSDLDKVLLERVGRHIVTTSKKKIGQSHVYRKKSINSKGNSSFGRSSHFQKDSQHTIARRSSMDLHTNFDSMIARYQVANQANQVQPQAASPPRTDERRNKTSLDFKQAKQFKNILEQPIGKMWFPSLGGAGATTSTIYSSTMPLSGKQGGAATVKGTLNKHRQAAQAGLIQERSRTQQKGRQVDKNAYFSKERQNNFQSVGPNGLNMTVPVNKDYERAKQIYENVGHVIQNQETLELRLKQSTSLKVKKNTNGISIQPLSEQDMRPFGISVPDNKNPSNIVLHDNTLTNEQQDILAKIRVNANQRVQPRLQSNSQSPIHQQNPKIFVQTKHSFKNVHQSLQQDTSLNQPKRTTSQYTIKDQVSNYINGRPCHSRSQQQSSTRSISSAGPTGYGNERDSGKFVQGREYQISQPELDHGMMQGLGSGIVHDEDDELTEKEKSMNMKVIRSKLKEQVIAEQRYLNEMAHIKTNNRTFQHQFHRINARSKVNMYVSPGLATQQNFTAARAAQPTVEGSLLKSRLVTNRWLNQVSKKKQELEAKMFKAGELRGPLPYSEYSITQKEAGSKNNYVSFQQMTSGRKKRSTLNSEPRSGPKNKSEYILNSKDKNYQHQTGSSGSPGMSQNTPGKDRSMDIRINGQESMFEDRPSQNQTVTSDDRSAYQARNQDALNSQPMSDINASDLDDDDQQTEPQGLNYQEALMSQAFSQLGNLKQRIDRQQNQDLQTRNLQFARVNEAMKQTQLMRDVEEEREILRLQEEMLQEEAKTNPDVLLSPQAMELKCIKPVPDVSQIYKDFGKVKQEENEYYTSHMQDEIDYAMSRQDALQVPMWSQDFAYRLVKLNQVDTSMWNTKFIAKVEDMIKEIDELDGALKRQAKDKHASLGNSAQSQQPPRQVGSVGQTATALKSSSIGQRGAGKSRKQVTVRVGNGPAK